MTENLTLPGWQNIGRIGAGGFGAVYEICMEDNPKYRAALKIITIPQDESELAAAYSEGMDDAGVTSYFQGVVNDVSREIAIMEHFKGITNIVSYEEHKVIRHTNDIGWDILIRMELLTPLQTFERARGYGLTEKETVKLGIDICRALVLCEKDEIVHRDIKPGNIFVNRFGDFVLGDFGIARQMEKSMSSMSVKGTYSYMAPEVYNGHHYGNTADIYSLGMVLYRCLNRNRGPFLPEAPTPITYEDRQNALYTRMAGQVIPEPRNGSAELKRLVLKAIAYNPGDRFLSAGELMEALQRVPLMEAEKNEKRDSGDEKTEKIKKKRVAGRQNRRRKNIKIALGIMAVAVVCLLAVFITMFSRRDAGNTYSKAIALMRQGAYEEAKNELNAIKGYEDSDDLLAECESMMRWYPVYQRIIEHTTVKGVDCITHSKEERDEIKKVVSDDVTVTEFDPKEPSVILGVFFRSSGGPDDFPVTIGDTKEKVFDQLGISQDMVEDGGCWPSYSDELKGISISNYTNDYSLGSIIFHRADDTSISLEFSADSSLLDSIAFWDETDHSKEIEEFVKQINYGEDTAIEWNSEKPLEVGDIVKFGHYEQDGNTDNGLEDISWYVVASEQDEVLLVSRLGLNIVEYDDNEEGSLNWSDCHIRKWLRDDFYPMAFDDEEKSAITSKSLEVKDHLTDDIAEVTEDSIFLLSADEVDLYLDDTQRLMLVSEYVDDLVGTFNYTTCGYYLRACYSGDNKLGWGVGQDGETRPYDCDGPLDYYPPVAVRPAIWLKQNQTETASANENSDNNEQINELGDSWTSFSVLIDNQKVTLPISYRELSSLGLNLSEPRNKILKTLDMEDIMSSSEMIYINDNDGDFYFANDSDEEINLDDCLTHRLSVKDTSIVFPKNVRVGDSIESVIEAYGNYQYASDKKTYYRWETKGSWNSLEIYTENNHVSRIELDVTNNSDNIPRTTENNTREDEYTSEKISSIAKNVWGSRVKWDDDVYAYFGFYEGDNPSECGMIFLSQQGDGSFHFSYYDGMATIEESDMDLGINILGRSVYTQKYTFAEESCVGDSGEKVLHIAHVDDGSLLVYIEDEKGEHYYHLSRGDLPTYCDLHDSLIGLYYG